MQFHQRNTIQLISFLWLLVFLACPPVAAPSPQDDSEQLFTQAVQDYKQNRFSEAAAKFARVQGSRAQDAQQYTARIRAYTDAMGTAKGVMNRSLNELDASSLDYAIQEYQEAIKIKADGPWHPAEEMQRAKDLKAQIIQRHAASGKAIDRDFCQKALAAMGQHHYKDAARYSCPLANDDPGYSCGGDEAVHMCEEMTALSKLDTSGPPPVKTTTIAGILDKGQAAYDKNDFERARTLFRQTPAELKSAANEFLDKISRYQDSMAQGENASQAGQYDDARTAFANAAEIKPDGPGDPRSKALLMELAEGLDQFYSGDYSSASQHLDAYARASTDKQPLAHFYLGASKLARFFLTGSGDAGLREDALNDLKIAKQAGFTADDPDVSPRIIQAYKDLTF